MASTNADIVRERAIGSGSGHARVRAEVRFRLANGTLVSAYIDLDHRLALGRPIPIYYQNSAPRTAAYAGPNSPISPDESIGSYIDAAIFFAAALMVLAFGFIWYCRTAAMRRFDTSAAVQFLWYQAWSTVTVTGRGGDKQFAWRVLPLDSPADWALRFFRLLRTGAARPRPKLSEILARARQEATATRPVLAEASDAEASCELQAHRWIALRSDGVLLVPTSRAEPVFGTGLVSQPPLTGVGALVADHRRLLAAYGTVLAEAAGLPMLIRPPSEDGKAVAGLRTALCWRVVVRLWIESHIRRQLGQLASAYARAKVLIAKTGGDADENRRRLVELREDCELLSSSLPDAPRRIGSLIIGLATLITVITAIIKAPQLPFVRGAQILAVVAAVFLLLVPGIFALVAFHDTFLCKRWLFSSYPFSSTLQAARGDNNVYQLEDAVFAHLSQSKRPERADDYWAQAIVLVALIATTISSFFIPPLDIMGSATFSLLALLWAGFLVKAFRDRRSRSSPRSP